MATRELNTRYYENPMPEIGDLVMVKVHSMTDTSAYVHLLEFNNIEGMVPFTELSRRRIRSVNQICKIGKMMVVVVIRVDRGKGYIDLSKKQVTPEERKKCEAKYMKSKKVTQIMQRVAQECEAPIESVMTKVAWTLYKSRQWPHAFDALKQAVAEPEAVLGPLDLDPKVYERVCVGVQHKLRADLLKIQADVDVTCFAIEGVDAIREVLLHGQESGQDADGSNVQVFVQAPPLYILSTQSEDKEEGIQRLWDVIDAMKEMMKKKGGDVETSVPPRVMGVDGAEEKQNEGEEDTDDEDE